MARLKSDFLHHRKHTALRYKEQTVNVFKEITAVPWENHTKRKYKAQYNTQQNAQCFSTYGLHLICHISDMFRSIMNHLQEEPY
jgi:hypothetical protein